jgi:hypothetical protein
MQIQAPVITIGWIIALIVLLLVIVFIATGQVPVVIGLLIGGCALSRLL